MGSVATVVATSLPFSSLPPLSLAAGVTVEVLVISPANTRGQPPGQSHEDAGHLAQLPMPHKDRALAVVAPFFFLCTQWPPSSSLAKLPQTTSPFNAIARQHLRYLSATRLSHPTQALPVGAGRATPSSPEPAAKCRRARPPASGHLGALSSSAN